MNELNNRLLVLIARPPSIVSMNVDGSDVRTLVSDCGGTPDGIAVDAERGLVYWTNMGEDFATNDGYIECVRFDGTERRIIIPKGLTCTPKQIQLDRDRQLLYWCDREGMRLMRARTDGTHVTVLVQTGSGADDQLDESRHCVGVALDKVHAYIYWTQKGPDDANKGRIFRAAIEPPAGATPDRRQDIELVFDGLPEPIDLEIDAETGFIYWTDRGAPPKGNTLNRARLDAKGCRDQRVLASGLEEGIGLALDHAGQYAFTSDLGGHVRRHPLSEPDKSEIIFSAGPLTGLAFVDAH